MLCNAGWINKPFGNYFGATCGLNKGSFLPYPKAALIMAVNFIMERSSLGCAIILSKAVQTFHETLIFWTIPETGQNGSDFYMQLDLHLSFLYGHFFKLLLWRESLPPNFHFSKLG